MRRVVAAKIRVGYLCRLLPLLLLVCLISSCLQIDYFVTINRDGSETVTAKVTAIKEIKLDKMETQLKTHGYKTSIETKNDSVYLVATQTFPSGKWEFPYPYGMISDSVKLTQSFIDYYFYKKYKLSAKYTFSNDTILSNTNNTSWDDDSSGNKSKNNLSANANHLFSIPIRYHFIVPGNIDTTTSTNVEVNTMNWHYNLEKGINVNVAFASTDYNYTLFIIIGLVVIALIFFVFARKIKLNAS